MWRDQRERDIDRKLQSALCDMSTYLCLKMFWKIIGWNFGDCFNIINLFLV